MRIGRLLLFRCSNFLLTVSSVWSTFLAKIKKQTLDKRSRIETSSGTKIVSVEKYRSSKNIKTVAEGGKSTVYGINNCNFKFLNMWMPKCT